MESYIQYISGFSKDNVNETDIIKAITDIQQMDDEHGAFWVSIITEVENIIEVNKSLQISVILEPDNDKEMKFKANDWAEVKQLYMFLLDKRFDDIKQMINKN